jgi:hypothetical protein
VEAVVQVDEASVVEQMLRDLCAEIELRPVIELDRLTAHEPAPGAGPVDWPAAEPPDPARTARWHTWAEQSRPENDGDGEAAAASSSDAPTDVPPFSSADARGDESLWRADGDRPQTESPSRVSQSCDPGAEIAALSEALDAVAAQDAASLPEPQALARARALLKATERLKALSLEALADVETRKLHTLDDAPTVNAWVNSLSVPGVDSRDITLARRLRRVPQIRTEIQAGRMSSRTGATLTTAVAKARPFLDRPDGLIDGLDGEQVLEGVLVDGICSLVAEQIGGAADAAARLAVLRDELVELNDLARTQLVRWEAALVVFARETDPSLLASGTALLVDALLPNEHDKRARQAEDARGLDLHRNTLGSGWHVKGDLDDETGEMLATVLDAAAATDPAASDDTRRHAHGQQALDDETLPPHQWPVDQPAPRSKRQQRHDALKRGLQALLDNGVLGVRGKVAPHVAVTVGLDFVEGVPGSLPARTDHGARLSREQVRKLLCRSTFTRLVLDARRRVVEASHTQRTSTALERLILKVQGGAVCLGSGCARGPATGHRLIPHHGSLFSHTGTTELADIVLLCEIEHDHELHGKGRNLTLKDGRVLGPEGWVRR